MSQQHSGLEPHGGTASAADTATARRASIAAFVGTAMEWYDFFLFTTAAALVFNVEFFTNENAFVAAMASFATLAVGFVARPIGGLLFGALGDRIGRRRVLLITVIGIGVVTALIGALPTYGQIGVLAPTLLVILRFAQGLAVGGEWSGAVTFSIEHAPEGQRARYAAIPQLGSPIGTILSSGGFFLVSALSSEQFFMDWGWRIPFLFAIPLLIVSVIIREHMEESPEFTRLEEAQELSEQPIREVFRTSWRQILIGAMVAFTGVGGFYVVTTFIVSYGKTTLGLNANLLLFAAMVAAVCEFVVLWIGGRIGMRVGAVRVAIVGSVLSLALAFPVFLLVTTRQPALVVLGMVIGVVAVSIPYAAQGAIMADLFPARLRLSGVSISMNIASLISGFLPMIATALVAGQGGAWWPVAVLLVVVAGLTLVGSMLAPRRSAVLEPAA
ncbi:MFS transporter [Pseudoclavibacter caeni]|jgi:MFS family permease|uniref:MHS family MFS transporter n=1 Tax=Pseudoclavibacter caeni TaxID=908846 RepID=A0A7C8BPU4_9MICO|nr:MFS transporter [Pseudoclavibacter caeni]KAB1633705.1 MHS family MFS transporter [Pseudoclavibacter caeni]NYJ96272.1 MFS family permease [Pseudoclavibacter caeni]